MTPTASKILGTVNAPYGVNVSVQQLADGISSIEEATLLIGPVFSFFSEVALELQKAFVVEMNLPVSVGSGSIIPSPPGRPFCLVSCRLG